MGFNTQADSYEVMRFLKNTGAKFDTLCGRMVMLIPIKEWGYAPVHPSLFNERTGHEEWVLVVEETGDTWIWDSWILEG